MKVRTPNDIAKLKGAKDKYTLYLSIGTMTDLKSLADKAGTSLSQLVDEAVAGYLAAIKDKKND